MIIALAIALVSSTFANAGGVQIEAVFVPSKSGALTSTALRALPGVVSVEPVFSASERESISKLSSKISEKSSLGGALKLRVRDHKAFNVLKRRGDLGGVLQLNTKIHLFSAPANPEQWGLRNTGIRQEVRVTDVIVRDIRGVLGEDAGLNGAPAEPAGKKVLVAVLDGGVQVDHPALAQSLHRTESECRAREAFNKCMSSLPDKAPCHSQFDQLDTDGNGYPMDCSGWDMTGENSEMTDVAGHGTHVSGIVAAKGFVSGVSAQAEILPVRVMQRGEMTDGTGFVDIVARGLLYAIRSHARVINMSFGYSIQNDSELVRKMVELAQEQGILVVSAAGNSSSRMPVFPCRYAGVVCVGAFSADGSLSHFSDYGDAVDLAAPGYGILSAWPTTLIPGEFTERRGYDFKHGTSMAAPFVSGALARLVGAGYDAREAYARLILGARSSLPPSAFPELEPKFVLSGNLDLKRAFEVQPQPLILPELKDSVFVPLDRQKVLAPTSAQFSFGLKNYWREGKKVEVRIKISSNAKSRLSFEGEGSEIIRTFDTWPAAEGRIIQGALKWTAPLSEIPGEFYFDVSISGAGMAPRSFKKTVEFIVPVQPMSLSMPLAIGRVATDVTPQSLTDDFAFRPIGCVAGPSEDLLLIQRNGKSIVLQLLKSERSGGAKSLKRSGGHLLDEAKEQLFGFSCLGDGQSRAYVVTSANSTEKKFIFTFFDSYLRHTKGAPVFSFSSDVTTLPEEFRWLAGFSANAPLSPVFVAVGKKPPSEKPAYDPWETRPEEVTNPTEPRLYFVDQAGIHTLDPPAGYRAAALLKPTRSELTQGTASVLLFKGTTYQLDLFVAKLSGRSWGPPQRVELPIYQRLVGLDRFGVMSFEPNGVAGTTFAERGTMGRIRMSILPNASEMKTQQPQAWVLEALKPGDFLTQVIAVYGEKIEFAQVFSRSVFQLYFHDRKTNAVLGTDLKQYDSVTRHLPARVGGIPALLMPEGQGTSLTTEVILPKTLDGRPQLFRPAMFKTLGVQGCEPILMKPTGFQGAGSGISEPIRRLTYYCGDHFVEIALEL